MENRRNISGLTRPGSGNPYFPVNIDKPSLLVDNAATDSADLSLDKSPVQATISNNKHVPRNIGSLDASRNSRPPTSHMYTPRSKTNMADFGQQSRPNSASRPFSPTSLVHSWTTEDHDPMGSTDMINALDEAKAMDAPVSVAANNSRRRRVIAVICVIGVILAVIVATTVVLLKNNDDDTEEPTTTIPTTTIPITTIPTTTIPTTTIPTTTIPLIIYVNDTLPYGGPWSSWSSWSTCSLSCNSGTQTRTRTCESDELQCLGVDQQQGRCNTALCAAPELESVWTTWSGWLACSVSCGGGSRLRERLCIRADNSSHAMDDCIGTSQQDTDCNQFSCPDCSTACSDGELEDSCAYCVCTDSVSGQVLSSERLPLSNVTISPTDAPYISLNVTSDGGFFNVYNVCAGAMYSFHKAGYQSTDAIFTGSVHSVTMQVIVNLQMTTNPSNVMSITGESVSMCCNATGSPPPDYYEWTKDGILIYTDPTQTISTLTVGDTEIADTGYYTCRASNDYSAIYSSPAALLVKDSEEEFCSALPESNIITLPDGCTYNNDSTIDQGSCGNHPCYSGAHDQCVLASTHCCAPTLTSRLMVTCDGYSIPVFLITECGCQECRHETFNVYGFAGSRTGEPLQFGDIYWNGIWKGNTSFDGTFAFSVDLGSSRISILFVDSYNGTFMDSTYVVDVASTQESSQYIRVYLVERGETTHILADEDNTLTIDSMSVEIDIPANSFFTADGHPYAGEVAVTFAVIDPSNLEDVVAAPGDFTTVNMEGESQPLVTYGMFALIFEDELGGRLSIPGEITITLPIANLGNETDENGISPVKIWLLNPSTGVWEFESDLQVDTSRRRRRQIGGLQTVTATLRGVDINGRWCNFDSISDQTCIVKVRLFDDDSYSESDQLGSGYVTTVVQFNGYNTMSRNRITNDYGNSNGHCMVVPCRSIRRSTSPSIRGYIFADFNDEQLVPASREGSHGLDNSAFDLIDDLEYQVVGDKIHVNFDQLLVSAEALGPYYDWSGKWRSSPTCANADYTHNHFRFARNFTCLIETDAYNIIPTSATEARNDNLLLWYDIVSHFQQPEYSSNVFWYYSSCYVKVAVHGNTKVEATTFIADDRHPLYETETNLYGARQDCADNGAVCIQVRPPGRVATIREGSLLWETKTLVKIRTIDRPFKVTNISQSLSTTYASNIVSDIGDEIFQIELHLGRSYGHAYGIYCNLGDTEGEAEQALHMCRNGDNSRTPRDEMTPHFPAVNFGAEGSINLIFVIDATGSMSGYTTEINSLAVAILDSVNIGHDGVNVALVTYNTQVQTHWDLNSATSVSYDLLVAGFGTIFYNSGGPNPFDAFMQARDVIIDGPRPDVQNVIIYISDGYESEYGAATVIQQVESIARILLVNTRAAAWSQMDEFNSYPEDRFDIHNPDHTDDIINILLTYD